MPTLEEMPILSGFVAYFEENISTKIGLKICACIEKLNTGVVKIYANAKFDLFKNFEAYSMKMPTNFNNTMHNKFCIIDLKTVIHGTFNWTNAANFNAETIDVTNDDRALAEQFSSEFLELKREAIKQMIASVF